MFSQNNSVALIIPKDWTKPITKHTGLQFFDNDSNKKVYAQGEIPKTGPINVKVVTESEEYDAKAIAVEEVSHNGRIARYTGY